MADALFVAGRGLLAAGSTPGAKTPLLLHSLWAMRPGVSVETSEAWRRIGNRNAVYCPAATQWAYTALCKLLLAKIAPHGKDNFRF